MSESKEFLGKTLDAAIADACAYYDVPREKLEIDIIEDAKSGIFGIVGARKAKIRARLAKLPDFMQLAAMPKPERDGRRRGRDVIGAGKIGVGVYHVDHMMPHRRLLCRRRLSGAYVHAAIDLHGVAGNQLAAVPLTQRKSERTFPTRRGANHSQKFRFLIHTSVS